MKASDLKDLIDSLAQDIEFEFHGMHGAICPFNRKSIVVSYGDNEKKYQSIDEVMQDAFWDGNSLADIAEQLNMY